MVDTYWTADDFASATNVPRGTIEDYSAWNRALNKWNARINLVSPRDLSAFWHRHAFDSYQLIAHLPSNWLNLADLGSGGGFPGIALAIEAKHRGRGHVHMVESVGKKTSFLKTVARELGLPVTVHTDRIESLNPLSVDVLTARAFAPLPRLFEYAEPHIADGAHLVLPKGETADKEIESARTHWNFHVTQAKSKTDPDAAILTVTGLERKEKA